MKKAALALTLFILCLNAVAGSNFPGPKPAASREYYELRTYYLKSAEQEQVLENYLREALLPALKRQGVKATGVFKPMGNDTASIRKVVVLIPLKDLKQAASLEENLDRDKHYLEKGKAYIQASYQAAPYQRMEKLLAKAFSDQPQFKQPSLSGPVQERVYELRSYESATEKIYRNKVKMFNEGGEIKLFERLGFNGIFYGEVIYGAKMPNLVYMTSFNNIAERHAHWKSFGEDAEWKTLSKNPEYQNNVSHIDITLMHPTEYSEL